MSNPDNGGVDIDGFNATYTCFLGYELEGENERECQENGTWTGQEPNCTCKSNSHVYRICPKCMKDVNTNVLLPDCSKIAL